MAFSQRGFGCVCSQDMLKGGNQKARRAAGRIADALAGLGVDHVNNHVDDVARGAELAVRAGHGDFAEQVLVHIAFEILRRHAALSPSSWMA